MARIAIFVDGANMFYGQREAHYFIDYKRVREYFSLGNTLFKAFFYVGATAPPAVSDKKFLDFLIYQGGYTVRTKPVKTIFDEATGEEKQKCNLDIEMAVEMFKEIEHYDTAVLMSGDGDFESVLELLRGRGKISEVVASRKMLARELANSAHRIHFLEEVRPHIERLDRGFGEPKKPPAAVSKTTAAVEQPPADGS